MDMPGPAKVHSLPMPRLGGIAIWIVVFALSIPSLFTMVRGGQDEIHRVLLVLAGGLCCALLGGLDDCRALNPKVRALAQAAIALGLVAAGIRIGGVPLAIAGLISFAWLMGAVNAVNLIDGLDGLAAGTCALSAISLALIGWTQHKPAETLVAACVAGSCVGFLFHNFYPARIFMGDNGSLFLGAVLGGLVLSLGHGPGSLPTYVGGVICLGLPTMDVLLVILRRVTHRRPLFAPDRHHFYDQLMQRWGLSQRQTVAVAYCLAAILGVAGFVAARASLPMALTLAGGLFVLAVASARFLGMMSNPTTRW